MGRPGAFALGLVLGLSLALAGAAEQRSLSLSQRIAPLLRPAGISKLEWEMAQAQLNDVEERIDKLTDAGSPDGYCCTSYRYDPAKDKVVARLRYGSDTADLLTVQELKQRLGKAGQEATARLSAETEVQDGIKLELKDFDVEFVTGLPEPRIFAVYRNGQVELTDRNLK